MSADTRVNDATLQDYIRTDRGDHLAMMARELQVSRAVMREAMVRLEATEAILCDGDALAEDAAEAIRANDALRARIRALGAT
jgi:hypothetical protein